MEQILRKLVLAGSEPSRYVSKLERTPKGSEWRASIQTCSPDPRTVERLMEVRDRITLVCFSTYWCKDCLKHVPELLVALQKADNGQLTLVMIDYDQNKKLAEETGVKAIPTIIIFGHWGTELGRIIENPSPPFRSVSEELLSKIGLQKDDERHRFG